MCPTAINMRPPPLPPTTSIQQMKIRRPELEPTYTHNTLPQRTQKNSVHREPEIKINNLIYLYTKNIAMPKGRASKLVPKYVGPYKIMKAIPSTSNYELELPIELIKR